MSSKSLNTIKLILKIRKEEKKQLIKKSRQNHHVTVAKPANGLTMKHHAEEIQRLKELNK
ncbi:hypothetical protein [Methanobrevibacter arboriphilus]|uniref:hypothetical protein n=1 Tax=Methanobrevibacter arboriphilus TaxID=39441 RepID=UPI0005B2C846|nr:hypothetical protein [Methanobrevibacter arboriphilus]